MDDLHAGITAGAITGLLFPTLFLLVVGGVVNDLQGFTSRASEQMATRGIVMPPQEIIFVLAIGFLFVSVACAGFGVILGVAFVKFVNRLSIPSIYFKSLGLGLLLYLPVSLPRLVLGRVPDIYSLAAIAADSVIFGFLFVRWTRRPLRVPKSNIKTRKMGVPKDATEPLRRLCQVVVWLEYVSKTVS